MSDCVSWSVLEQANQELAELGRELLYRDDEVAGAMLATVGTDGCPRVHPVAPVLAAGELWLLIVNMSPKYRDLARERWFALHTLPSAAGGQEFHLRGRVEEVLDPETRARVVAATGGRQGGHDFESLFRCLLRSVLHTRWDHWGTARAWPNYTKWVPDSAPPDQA